MIFTIKRGIEQVFNVPDDTREIDVFTGVFMGELKLYIFKDGDAPKWAGRKHVFVLTGDFPTPQLDFARQHCVVTKCECYESEAGPVRVLMAAPHAKTPDSWAQTPLARSHA